VQVLRTPARQPHALLVLNPAVAPRQVLVHGEAGGMMRLKEALRKQAALRGEARQFYTPALGQPVRIPHKAERTAKACPQAIVCNLSRSHTWSVVPMSTSKAWPKGASRLLTPHARPQYGSASLTPASGIALAEHLHRILAAPLWSWCQFGGPPLASHAKQGTG